MFKIKNIVLTSLKYHELKGSFFFVSSLHIVRRRFSKEGENMSGRSLPKWIAPEGSGELKLYNSLTREKVEYFPFLGSWTPCFSAWTRSDAIFPVNKAIKLLIFVSLFYLFAPEELCINE